MQTEYDKSEDYVHQESPLEGLTAGDYPFFTPDSERLIRCQPAEFFTGATEESGGRCFGVVAIANKGGGLFSAFTADELREAAKQLGLMADYIDGKNGG